MKHLIIKKHSAMAIGVLFRTVFICLLSGCQTVSHPAKTGYAGVGQDREITKTTPTNSRHDHQKETVPTLVITPASSSITQSSIEANEKTSLTIDGSAFDSRSIAEVYNSSGKLVWSGPIRGYTLKINNPNKEQEVREISEGAPVDSQLQHPKDTEPIRIETPAIVSIVQSSREGTEKFTLTISGTGFDSGSVAEVYNSSGKLVWSGTISGVSEGAKRRQVKVSGVPRDLHPGKYTLKVRNSKRRYSKAKAFTIEEPKIEPCLGGKLTKPKVIYLGGGAAKKLFERYLSQNPDIGSNLPRDLKIIFYERKNGSGDISTRTIGLEDMEQMFVESQEDFLEKIKEKLKGKIAEHITTLADKAQKGGGDYFQCPSVTSEE